MKQTQRQVLFNQYKSMSDDELRAILMDDSYGQLAKEIAKEILNGDRSEYHKRQKEISDQEKSYAENENIKHSAQQTNPLYDDMHQMSKDIKVIKNCLVVLLIITAFLALTGIFAVVQFLSH